MNSLLPQSRAKDITKVHKEFYTLPERKLQGKATAFFISVINTPE